MFDKDLFVKKHMYIFTLNICFYQKTLRIYFLDEPTKLWKLNTEHACFRIMLEANLSKNLSC